MSRYVCHEIIKQGSALTLAGTAALRPEHDYRPGLSIQTLGILCPRTRYESGEREREVRIEIHCPLFS